MKKYCKKLLLSFVFFASTDLFAQDILYCANSELDFYREKCTIVEKKLFSRACLVFDETDSECIERTMSIDYDFPCKGEDPHGLGVSSIEKNDYFQRNGSNLKVTGFGPFYLKDLNPTLTKEARFLRGCFLSIESIDIDISKTEEDRLKVALDELPELQLVRKSVEIIASDAVFAKSLLVSLNPEEIDGLLDSLLENFKIIRDSVAEENIKNEIDHLSTELLEAKSKNSPDLIKREQYESSLSIMVNVAESIQKSIVTKMSRNLTLISTRLLFAANETKIKWQDKYYQQCSKLLPPSECLLKSKDQ